MFLIYLGFYSKLKIFRLNHCSLLLCDRKMILILYILLWFLSEFDLVTGLRRWYMPLHFGFKSTKSWVRYYHLKCHLNFLYCLMYYCSLELVGSHHLIKNTQEEALLKFYTNSIILSKFWLMNDGDCITFIDQFHKVVSFVALVLFPRMHSKTWSII